MVYENRPIVVEKNCSDNTDTTTITSQKLQLGKHTHLDGFPIIRIDNSHPRMCFGTYHSNTNIGPFVLEELEDERFPNLLAVTIKLSKFWNYWYGD